MPWWVSLRNWGRRWCKRGFNCKLKQRKRGTCVLWSHREANPFLSSPVTAYSSFNWIQDMTNHLSWRDAYPWVCVCVRFNAGLHSSVELCLAYPHLRVDLHTLFFTVFISCAGLPVVYTSALCVCVRACVCPQHRSGCTVVWTVTCSCSTWPGSPTPWSSSPSRPASPRSSPRRLSVRGHTRTWNIDNID